MTNENGKVFSLITNKEFESYIYNIEKYQNGKISLEKLEFSDEIVGKNECKRSFYLKNTLLEGNDLLVITIKEGVILLNRYILDNNNLKVQKNISNVFYEVFSNNEDSEIEFQYVDEMKKSICVFDVNNKCEVIPACFYNSEEHKIHGRYKLSAYKKYVVLKLGKDKK